ncbi:MAG: BON domain-containing protein [Hyphococcus sp.]
MTSVTPRIILVAAMLALGACASSRGLDDSVADLTANAELKGVLFTDRDHDYSDVDITIHEGRLMLTGTMRTEEGHQKLLANAWKADGVDQVIDEILIEEKTSFGQGFEDTRIDQTLRAKLLADNDVTSGDFKIAVSQATVYLIGSTRTQGELDEALRLARSIAGVEKVVHYVNVRMPEPATLQQ